MHGSLVTSSLLAETTCDLSLNTGYNLGQINAVARQSYAFPSYPYISYDYVTTLALYVHHNWISSLLMVGAFAHVTIFIIRIIRD